MEFHALIDRVRGEFIEMPGLVLTPAQAERLWGLDTITCRRVIEVLVTAAFLRWTQSGMVVRVEAHRRPARVLTFSPDTSAGVQ